MTIDLFRPFMHQPAVNEAVARVLSYDADGRLYCGEGPLVKEFERRFAALVGADPATVVAVNSCSSALALALQLAGVGRGDDVVSTPQTCTATNEAIVNAGARIVWADIDRLTGNIDPADVARKITGKTKAIMTVNWSGRRGTVEPFYHYGIPIIEDAAHGPFTPSDADYTAFSFGPIKHLSCGHGGALIAPERVVPRARKLRWHSLDRESSADFRCAQTIEEPGHLWHMSDIEAAIGLANLPHAEWVVARHRANAAFYDRALRGAPGISTPPVDEGSSYWCYFLQVEARDSFQKHMAAKGIATSPVHAPNHLHPAYHFPNGPLPGVDHYAARCCAIPTGWWVDDRAREKVASAVLEFAYGERWVAA